MAPSGTSPAATAVRLAAAPAGAAEDAGEGDAAQALSQLSGLCFAVFGQRNIGAAGMLVGQRPGRFAVPNEIQVEGHVG